MGAVLYKLCCILFEVGSLIIGVIIWFLMMLITLIMCIVCFILYGFRLIYQFITKKNGNNKKGNKSYNYSRVKFMVR